jgi:apolipoprotein N-acyltransferase
VYWLYISMHRYGGMPAWLAALAVVLMALLLGSITALGTGAALWLKQRRAASAAITALLILPACWALSEWLRGWVFTGFPWIVSGYAHNASPLAGFAPLVGVYGIGWIAALLAGAIALLPLAGRSARYALAALLIATFAAGSGLQQVAWTHASGQPLSVRLLQGNVPQEMKFSATELGNTLALYRNMIEAAPADLIATPETAIPLFIQQLPPDYLPQLTQFARQSGSRVALGIPLADGPEQYANGVLGLGAGGAQPYRYDKHHLVPFGEFIPPGFRWFVDRMQIPLGDFTRGAALQAPFPVKDQAVLPNICYEDLFGEEIAAQIAAHPDTSILLNLSNIAWFGDSIALPQHLQVSQMRALETGRPMLRATNTGATAIIEPDGKVSAQLAPYTRATLTATVRGYQGSTPYILYGNSAMLALAALALVAAWLFSADSSGNKTAGRRRSAHGAAKTR